jgi:hypothetical protein
MKADWIGNIWQRNYVLKHVTERKIAGTRREGRRRRQSLGYLKDNRK